MAAGWVGCSSGEEGRLPVASLHWQPGLDPLEHPSPHVHRLEAPALGLLGGSSRPTPGPADKQHPATWVELRQLPVQSAQGNEPGSAHMAVGPLVWFPNVDQNGTLRLKPLYIGDLDGLNLRPEQPTKQAHACPSHVRDRILRGGARLHTVSEARPFRRFPPRALHLRPDPLDGEYTIAW